MAENTGEPPRGYVDPNFPSPNGPNDAPIIIYGYTPHIAVGVLGVILFFISLVWHCWQLFFKYRPCWYFTPIIVGCTMEVVGYVPRILANRMYTLPDYYPFTNNFLTAD